MTLHDYAELVEYWADHPPAHLLAAVGLGRRPRPREPSDARTRQGGAGPSRDAAGLLDMAPSGVGSLETLRGLR
jgi:hypothetical protein